MRQATLIKIAQQTNVKLMRIKSCSTTRWACRAEAVKPSKAILNNYDCLLLAIEEICNNCTNPEMSAKVSSVLQSPKLNLLLAIDNVRSLKLNLKIMRNENILEQPVALYEMKISVYYDLLDDLLSAMESRFSQETLNLIEAIASLLHMEIKPEMIDILAKFSNTSSTDLKTEVNLLKHLPKSDKPNVAEATVTATEKITVKVAVTATF
ncbi:hypothetical protein QTP88_011495 [Uroleucon formosanum]